MMLRRALLVPAFLSLLQDQRPQVPPSQVPEGVAGQQSWLGWDSVFR